MNPDFARSLRRERRGRRAGVRLFFVAAFAYFAAFARVWALFPSADLFLHWENIAAGTTDGSINLASIAITNGTAMIGRSWTGSGVHVSVENGGMNYGMLRPVLIGSTYYTNTAFTKHLLVKCDISSQQKIQFTFAPSRKASLGYFITVSNFVGLGSFYNPASMETSTDYTALSLVDESVNGVYFQNEGNTPPYGENIIVQNNTPYWVCHIWDSAQANVNNRSRMYIYNATNWTLVGFSIDPNVTQNHTVNTFNFGVTSAHSFNAGTVYRLGAALLYTNGIVAPVWPGSELSMPTNFSPAGMTEAISKANDGDYILLPATNTTWTSMVTMNKNKIHMSSVLPDRWGSNKTAITISGALTDPSAALKVDGYMNVFTNFMIKGAGVSEEADGIANNGQSNVYAFLHMQNLAVPFHMHESCLVKYCNTVNNDFVLGRDNRNSSYYFNNAPLAKTSLKHAVFETGLATWNASKLDGGNETGFSSQVGAAWYVRDYDFAMESSGVNPAPGFDAHGESPGLTVPILSGILISNRFTRGPTAWNGKFVDVRSPNVWVLYNIVTGVDVLDGVFVRNEDAPFPISNCYIIGNKDGAAGNVAMTVQDDGTATAGVDYILTAPPDPTMIAYPHPWWLAVAAGTFPSPAPEASIPQVVGAPKIRGLKFVR